MNWADCTAVDRNPKKLGGAWCFVGTRLAVLSLFEHLDRGSTIDEFLEPLPRLSSAMNALITNLKPDRRVKRVVLAIRPSTSAHLSDATWLAGRIPVVMR